MRQKRTLQKSIFDDYAQHQIGRELCAMSELLDANPRMLDWVHEDLPCSGTTATGCKGSSAETALRCALLKQYRQLSYEELAFHLQDSLSFRAFARLPAHFSPRKSSLQSLVSAIRPQTWEQINRVIVGDAASCKVETGKTIRIDSTVTETTIHAPSDDTLLFDCVRVIVRLMEQAEAMPSAPELTWHNHRRVAKRRARQIAYSPGSTKRHRWYRDLIRITRTTLGYLNEAASLMSASRVDMLTLHGWLFEVDYFRPLIEQIIDQAHRRVIDGESVPVDEKLFSLFEVHTDLIKKDRRAITYGHKLNLVSGRSGLIIDAVVEAGNPADSVRLIPMLERQVAIYGKCPRQVATDGGYASKENLKQAKALGVEDVAFHKKRGITVEEMVKSKWVYRQLRNFRAGIEAGISTLKRAYGLSRCSWKGLEHFNAYVWSSVVAYNIALLVRRTTAPPT